MTRNTNDRKGKYQAVSCTVISSGGGVSAWPEADGKSVGEAARAALGRIAQMSNSAETEEHLMKFNSLIQLPADGVSLPYQVLFSALGVS